VLEGRAPVLEGRAPVWHGYARGCVRTYISGSFKELNLANSAVKSEGNEDELTHKGNYFRRLFKGIGTANKLFFKRQMLSVREADVSKEGGQSLSNEKASTCIDADACYFIECIFNLSKYCQ